MQTNVKLTNRSKNKSDLETQDHTKVKQRSDKFEMEFKSATIIEKITLIVPLA